MAFWRIIRLLATLLLASGILLHLTVRDAWAPAAVLFYALPLPVLAGCWLVLSCLWGWKGRAGLVCLAFACVSASWWFAACCREAPLRPNQTPVLKVFYWNMAHRALPSTELERLLREHQPDIAGFVEVGRRHGDPNPLTAKLPAGCAAFKLDHGMAVVVRGTMNAVRQEVLPSSSKFAAVEVTVDGVRWQLFIVDGVSRPTTSRKDVLDRVLAESRGLSRVVIVGDFNTPVESSHFSPWQDTLHHAFNEAGSGFRETWPRWVPVLSIDHVWSSADVPPLKAQLVWSHDSDHAALAVELGARRR